MNPLALTHPMNTRQARVVSTPLNPFKPLNYANRLMLLLAALCLTAACSGGASGSGTASDTGGDSLSDGSNLDAKIGDSTTGKDGTGGGTTSSTPTVVTCPKALPAPKAAGSCDVTKGSSVKVLRGTVLASDHVYVGGEVVIDAKGIITCAACDCASSDGYSGATTLQCGDAVISPALINSHDHITFAQNAPKPHMAKYDHRHEWRKGLNGKPKISVPGAPNGTTNDVTGWGELRFVIGGATSTVGSGGVNGMLRNLDKPDPMQGGLGKTPIDFETFPLGDSSPTGLPTTCTYKIAATDADVAKMKSFFPHMSEGVDESAHNEFDCTDGVNAQANYERPQTALIHAVGLRAADIQLAANTGVSLIWSPRSNIDLYGFTANVSLFANVGVPIALGTDWSASGSMNMLRELACADSYNQKNLGGFFNDYQLFLMVTGTAADAAKMGDVLGRIAAGRPADVTIFASHGKPPYSAVVHAAVEDVALVLRGGTVLHGDAALVDALSSDGGAGCEALSDCLSGKKLCAKRELGKDTAGMSSTIGSPYPLFFCGVPKDEPSCVPSRLGVFTGEPSASDKDGDGIEDSKDLCPTVFSAIRPMDGGKQLDSDGDGTGDGCDICPLTANSTDCSKITVPVDQPDTTSGDSSGADAGSSDVPPTTATIPEIKKMAVGTVVEVKGLCITAIRTVASGSTVWVQQPGLTSDGGYVVYSKTAVTNKVGDAIDVVGSVGDFKGLPEILTPAITTTGACSEVILPVAVSPSDIATGGAKVKSLMSMLVEVSDVTVATAAATAKDDFVVDGGLRISPFVYAFDGTQFPVGKAWKSIRGVLDWYTDHSKIDPLVATDLVEP